MPKTRGLWYVSQPSSLAGVGHEAYRETVLRDLISQGYDVIHPFNAMPYEHFEGNRAVGREKALVYCCQLIDACKGQVLVTGLSPGVLTEVAYAVEKYGSDTIRVFSNYDPDFYELLAAFRDREEFSIALGAIALALEEKS